jgi:hypothetical protein
MTHISALALAVFALFCLLAFIAIWSRRQTRWRFVAVMVALLSIPAVAAAGLEALSWPRPLWAMWELRGQDIRVLGAKLVKDVAIYLYLEIGEATPRSVALAWDTEQAKQIQKLMDDSNAKGESGEFMMKFKFEFSWEKRDPPQFYELPQPDFMPPKIPQPEAPKFEL